MGVGFSSAPTTLKLHKDVEKMGQNRYPTQMQFQKIFQEKTGKLLLQNGFVYTKKFRCYYRFASSDILQIYSNRIYSRGSNWDAYIGIYPLCDAPDSKRKLAWHEFYYWQFSSQMRTVFWDPNIKNNFDQVMQDYFSMEMNERLEYNQCLLQQYIFPVINQIQTFSDYMLFISKMPQYTTHFDAMLPLLGRYGRVDEIDNYIDKLSLGANGMSLIKDQYAIWLDKYIKMKQRRLEKGAESFEAILRKYAKETRTRLDTEMEAPLQKFSSV